MVRHLTPPSGGEYRSSSSERIITYEEGTEPLHEGEEGFPLATWSSDVAHREQRFSEDEDDLVRFELFTQDEERKVVSKLDRRLVLFVALLYMLSFLDRSNIGNAKAAGMETDLGITHSQFHLVLDGFYITYILFEFMTICYKIFPAHIYISVCVSAMGIIAALQSISTGFWSMFVLRLCLGMAEASFGPGIPFYLSLFFKREELARRVGFFIAAAPLANCLSGSLAWLILRFASRSGIDGWRLLFIAEGFPNVVLAVLAWSMIPDSPGTTRWLNTRERKIASMRLLPSPRHVDSKASADSVSQSQKGVQWGSVAATFKDPKSYLLAAILFSLNVAFSSLPVFLPTIVENMGFSPLAAQAMSALPNLPAYAAVLTTASLSDRLQCRSIPLVASAVLAMSGYALLALAPGMPHLLRYLCLFPITAGFFSAVTVVIVWTVNNQESDEGKAVGSSILQVFGHVGSLLGQQLYPDSGAPFYVTSHAVCAISMALAAVLALVLRMVLKRANRNLEVARGGYRNREDGERLIGGSEVGEVEGRGFQYIL